MKNFFVLFIILLTAGVTPAVAADWEYIGREGNKSSDATWAIDLDSMRRSGNLRRVWVQLQVIAPGNTLSHVSERIFFQIDCKAWTIRGLNFIKYNEDGAVADSWASSRNSSPVTPDSIGEAMAQYVCKQPLSKFRS